MSVLEPPVEVRLSARLARALAPGQPLRWTILVYLSSRLLLLAVAVAAAGIAHTSLASELGRWDGTWYMQLASTGYPRHPSSVPSTLGFFPLYPLVIWLTVHAPGPPNSALLAGLLVSCAGGLVATVLVGRLAAAWWGEGSGRRAVLLFCFFPGSIVFSMVYAEGLLIPLAAGCLLALERRRWVLAGSLAGVATAVAPDAVVLVVVCALCAARELRAHGWRSRQARRSLLAPALSGVGISAFAVFLWVWTGTPFATLQAQRDGWGESVDPLALARHARLLAHDLSGVGLGRPDVYAGHVAALLGALFLLAGVALLLRRPRLVSVEAMALTLGVGCLALVSENVPPNPRLLITAFPVVLVFAHRFRMPAYRWLLASSTLLLVLTSGLTYGSRWLTP